MAKPIKAKLVLEKRAQGLSMNEISSQFHVSKHSVCSVLQRAEEKHVRYQDVIERPEAEVYALLFPEKQSVNVIHESPDYEYVTRELKKVGVTLKLLHAEYVDACKSTAKIAAGYAKFCADYEAYRIRSGYTNRVIHKPGLRVEVDWSGPTMQYLDRVSGQKITVFLFVATLPYSQCSYVQPCPDMRQTTWLQCHVDMWAFFGGVTHRIVCDNLKTGVISHPKEGEIILNEEYQNLAEHYGCSIMPAGVRKPKHYPQSFISITT